MNIEWMWWFDSSLLVLVGKMLQIFGFEEESECDVIVLFISDEISLF